MHIGQRALRDRRQRIGEVALLERGPQIDRLDLVAAAAGRLFICSHDQALAKWSAKGKDSTRLRCGKRPMDGPSERVARAARDGRHVRHVAHDSPAREWNAK
jgi:hypothetical protein